MKPKVVTPQIMKPKIEKSRLPCQHRQNHPAFIAVTFMLLWINLLLAPAAAARESHKSIDAPVPMHNLSNEALLQQASEIYDQASGLYRAELRGLAKNRYLLNKAQKQMADFQAAKTKGTVTTPPLKAAKIAADNAKTRMDNAKQRLALLNAEKTALDHYLHSINPAQSSANHFVLALNDLDLYSFELRQRVNDGTLKGAQIPSVLRQSAMDKEREKIRHDHGGLGWQAKVAAKKSKQITKDIKSANQTFISAQALHASAEKKYNQELGGKSLEQEYLQQSGQNLLTRLAQLNEELVWLKGAFNLSLGHFNDTNTKAQALQQTLDQLKAPEQPNRRQNTLVQIEAIEQAAGQVETLVAYHTERIELLEQQKSSLTTLINQSETFQGDGSILNSHFFTMQVISRVLVDFARQGKIKLSQIPANNRLDVLTKANEAATLQATEAHGISQMANKQRVDIDQAIEKSKNIRTDIQARLAQMKETAAAARNAQQINAGLKDLTAAQIIERFDLHSAKITGHQQTVEQAQAAYQTQLEVVAKAQKHFENLKGPLLLTAQQAASAEQQKIATRLHEMAKVELPAAQKSNGKGPTSTVKSTKTELENPLDNKHYQNLIATRVRVFTTSNEAKQRWLDGLKTLQQRLESYTSALNEANNLALQHYANASEVKKRAGRQELQSNDIPAGVAKGLKRNGIAALEQQIASLAEQQIQLPQQIKTLETIDQTNETIQTLSSDVLALVGSRLDKLQDLAKLQQQYDLNRNSLSSAELKSSQQAALRRLKSEDSFREYLASFVPAQSTQNMTELLQDYFLELTEIEEKQHNLDLQTAKVEDVLKQAEDEKTLISRLLPVFQQEIGQLKDQQTALWAQAQFSPETAEDKIAAINVNTTKLYNYHTQIMAAESWIKLFNQRLSSGTTGLVADIGQYQEIMGDLASKSASLQRRVNILSGHSADQLPPLEPGQIPMTAQEQEVFLAGEINLLRTERLKVSTQTGFWVFIKLAVIALLTFLLLTVINRIADKTIAREQEQDSSSEQNLLMYSLFRGVSKLIVWALAAILGLHFIGFDVGAILAGLGIFGFAIAMASRELIGNLIGGINLLVAKPFEVGDYISFDGRWCGVEKIGLQYTRLREFATNFIIIVPNSKLSEAPLINTNADHKSLRNTIELPLSRRSTPEQIELAVELVQTLVEDNDAVVLKQLFVKNFDDYAFILNLRYDVMDIGNFANAYNQIQLGIIKLFAANGIEFSAKAHYNVDPLIDKQLP